MVANLHYRFLSTQGVSTDTRSLQEGELFFALSGENFNANEYVGQALEKGAAYVVMDDPKFFVKEDRRMLLVEDVLKTLQDLASFHRNYLGLPIIALTGSNGKTTTKNLIERVLSQRFKVQATKGNLNNHIGVPLTLLSMTEEHDIGLVEMGANHPGEIAALCEIAAPNYGYITNFGKAHLEGFGSLEGVIKAKAELYNYIAANSGTVFVYEQDTEQMKLTTNHNRILFQSSLDASGSFQLLSAQPKLEFRYETTKVTTDLVGAYNFLNCIAALVIGKYFGVSKEEAVQAIVSYTPDNNRSQIVQTPNNLLLLDAYNANPTSMQTAIESFIKETESSNKAMILGDMLELGSYAEAEHQAVVDLLSAYPNLEVFLVGENFYKTKTQATHIHFYKTRDALGEVLENRKLNASYILLKGSRGIALEKLVAYL